MIEPREDQWEARRELCDRDHGRFGSLFVTNYKLSFVPLERSQDDECSQRNILLGPYDAALTSVGAVWLTDGGPARRRRLMPKGDMPGKVKGLQVICKVAMHSWYPFVN
ncbi:uncharacterized protein [Choristoneura fumiferana]|uniref:uncharacterized protein n=1 Tax=Choristoneura fumiferana TaxID=7141 RepID=UPI003D15B1F7